MKDDWRIKALVVLLALSICWAGWGFSVVDFLFRDILNITGTQVRERCTKDCEYMTLCHKRKTPHEETSCVSPSYRIKLNRILLQMAFCRAVRRLRSPCFSAWLHALGMWIVGSYLQYLVWRDNRNGTVARRTNGPPSCIEKTSHAADRRWSMVT